MEITLPYKYQPLPHQEALLKAMDGGFKRSIIVWHRRGGKDKTSFNILIKKAFERVGTYFYFLPSYTQAKKVIWDNIDNDGFKMLDHIPKELIASSNSQELKIDLINGSVIQLIGADVFSMSGVGTNPVGVVFSEYSITDANTWKFVSPILAANGGWAMFNFTPRGMNHAYDLYLKAKNDPKWFVQLLTVDDTGLFSNEALDEERNNHPREIFEQEYYCKFVAGENAVFRDWRKCIEGQYEVPVYGRQYLCSVDLARTFDRTVIFVADAHKNHIVYKEVMENTPWAVQKMRIERVISMYNNAQTIVDATGVGDAFVEQLYNTSLPIQAFKISGNAIKKGLIEKVQMFLENRYITFPHFDMLEEELDAFEYGRSPSGVVTFSAPSGMHDDCVMSLALLIHIMSPQPIPFWRPTEYDLAREEMSVDSKTGYLI
jgi:Terminase RNaseH-like domain